MTESELIPLLTGSGGCIIALGWWNWTLRADKKADRIAWDKQIEAKDERIKELTDENQKIGVECVGAITRVMESLNRLTPCKFSHDSKPS